MINTSIFILLFAIFMTINAIIAVALILIGTWAKETTECVRDFEDYWNSLDGDEDATRY